MGIERGCVPCPVSLRDDPSSPLLHDRHPTDDTYNNDVIATAIVTMKPYADMTYPTLLTTGLIAGRYSRYQLQIIAAIYNRSEPARSAKFRHTQMPAQYYTL